MSWCKLKVGLRQKANIRIKANSMSDAVIEIQNKMPVEFFVRDTFLIDFDIIELLPSYPTNADKEKEGQLTLTIP